MTGSKPRNDRYKSGQEQEREYIDTYRPLENPDDKKFRGKRKHSPKREYKDRDDGRYKDVYPAVASDQEHKHDNTSEQVLTSHESEAGKTSEAAETVNPAGTKITKSGFKFRSVAAEWKREEENLKTDTTLVTKDKEENLKTDASLVTKDKDQIHTSLVAKDKEEKLKTDASLVAKDKEEKLKTDTPLATKDKNLKIYTSLVSKDKEEKLKTDASLVTKDKNQIHTSLVAKDKEENSKTDTSLVTKDKLEKAPHRKSSYSYADEWEEEEALKKNNATQEQILALREKHKLKREALLKQRMADRKKVAQSKEIKTLEAAYPLLNHHLPASQTSYIGKHHLHEQQPDLQGENYHPAVWQQPGLQEQPEVQKQPNLQKQDQRQKQDRHQKQPDFQKKDYRQKHDPHLKQDRRYRLRAESPRPNRRHSWHEHPRSPGPAPRHSRHERSRSPRLTPHHSPHERFRSPGAVHRHSRHERSRSPAPRSQPSSRRPYSKKEIDRSAKKFAQPIAESPGPVPRYSRHERSRSPAPRSQPSSRHRYSKKEIDRSAKKFVQPIGDDERFDAGKGKTNPPEKSGRRRLCGTKFQEPVERNRR